MLVLIPHIYLRDTLMTRGIFYNFLNTGISESARSRSSFLTFPSIRNPLFTPTSTSLMLNLLSIGYPTVAKDVKEVKTSNMGRTGDSLVVVSDRHYIETQ